jgi:hypothetical protein
MAQAAPWAGRSPGRGQGVARTPRAPAGRGPARARRRRLGSGVPVGGRDGEAEGEPAVGPAQRAGLAPRLGNVSRHEGRDLGGATEGRPRRRGTATLSREGDDCIRGCEREDAARRVGVGRDQRRARVGRPRPPDTTRRVPLGRPPQGPHSGTGLAPCDLVGGTGEGARARQGRGGRGGTTRRASRRRTQEALDAWGRRPRPPAVKTPHAARRQRVRGHLTSCGVRGTWRRLRRRVEATKRAGYIGLGRRSPRTRLPWQRCGDLRQRFPLPRPRMTVRIWGGEPRVTATAEPDGGNLLVRLWRGAGTGNLPAYSTSHFSHRPPCARPPTPCHPAPAGVCVWGRPARLPWHPPGLDVCPPRLTPRRGAAEG